MKENSKYNGVKLYPILKHSDQGKLLHECHNEDNVNDMTKSQI